MVWRGVAWRGVVWCGVVWYGAVLLLNIKYDLEKFSLKFEVGNAGFFYFVQDYNINLLKHHSRLVHCCTTPFLVCEEWISSIEEKTNLSASQKEIVRVIDCFQRS